MRGFVSEYRTLDSFLFGNGVVNVLALDENSGGVSGSQDNRGSRSNELRPLSAISVSVGAVVSLIDRQAGTVAVFRDPPKRLRHRPQPFLSSLPLRGRRDGIRPPRPISPGGILLLPTAPR